MSTVLLCWHRMWNPRKKQWYATSSTSVEFYSWILNKLTSKSGTVYLFLLFCYFWILFLFVRFLLFRFFVHLNNDLLRLSLNCFYLVVLLSQTFCFAYLFRSQPAIQIVVSMRWLIIHCPLASKSSPNSKWNMRRAIYASATIWIMKREAHMNFQLSPQIEVY